MKLLACRVGHCGHFYDTARICVGNGLKRRGERLAGTIISAGPDRDNHVNGRNPIPWARLQAIPTNPYLKSQIRERVAKPSVAAQAKIAVEMMQKLRATVAMAWVPIPRSTVERRAARNAIAKKTFTETSYVTRPGIAAKCTR